MPRPKNPNSTFSSIKPLWSALALLLVLVFFVRIQLNSITPLSDETPLNQFSAARAFTSLEGINPQQIPHPVDSQANRKVELAIVNELQQLGFVPQIQQATACHERFVSLAICAQVRNIILHIKGSGEGQAILLAAHYDSVAAGPGGSDAGAAVGSLLEIARLSAIQNKDKSSVRNDIILLFNEGEEVGLLGAKAFMQEHPLAKSVKVALNIEARGSSGKSVMFETGEDSGWLVQHYAQTTPAPLSSSLFYEVYKILPNDTDLTVFKAHGLRGLNFAHAENLPHYHTPLDNLTNLDKGSLQHHGDNVWGVLKAIQNVDLNQQQKGNRVYTDILGLWVIDWSEPLSLAISVTLLLLFIIACWRLHKGEYLAVGVIAKAKLNLLASLIAAAVMGYLILSACRWFSESSAPWRADPLPMQIALWSGVAFIVLWVMRLGASNSSAINRLVAVTSLWILLAIAASYWMAGVSFLFILPAAVAIVLLILWPWLNKQEYLPLKSAGLIFVATSAAIIFMPVVYVLQIMMGFSLAIAEAVVLAFALSGLLPLMVFPTEQQGQFRIKLLGLVLVSTFGLVWVINQAHYTEWMPQALNLTLVQTEIEKQEQGESKTSFVLPEGATVSKELDNALLGLTLEGSSKKSNQSVFPWSHRQYTSFPLDQASLPEMSISTEVNSSFTTLNLNTDKTNLLTVRVYLNKNSGIKSLNWINGEDENKPLFERSNSEKRRSFSFVCRGESCAHMQLEIGLDKPQASLTIASIYAGLPAKHQSLKESRGKLAVPRQDGDTHMLVKTIEL